MKKSTNQKNSFGLLLLLFILTSCNRYWYPRMEFHRQTTKEKSEARKAMNEGRLSLYRRPIYVPLGATVPKELQKRFKYVDLNHLKIGNEVENKPRKLQIRYSQDSLVLFTRIGRKCRLRMVEATCFKDEAENWYLSSVRELKDQRLDGWEIHFCTFKDERGYFPCGWRYEKNGKLLYKAVMGCPPLY